MLTTEQFEKARQFIYRHGRLLERKRFAYQFEEGSREAVLEALGCYQNRDGGFGHGLELDLMCPASSPICTEVGLAILFECGAENSAVADRAAKWVLDSQQEDGRLPHPVEEIEQYPHGPWWLGDDDARVLALAGLLGRLGRGSVEFYARTAGLFRARYVPFPEKVGVYDYPLHIYLNHAPGAEQFGDERNALTSLVPAMLAEEAWHCPLFFCHDRWYSEDISDAVWREEGEKAVGVLRDDGGVAIEQYANLPWWRPVWTLELLIRLREQGLA